MKIAAVILLFAAAAMAATISSSPTFITFDELEPGEQILNYYSGGFGSLGSGPGPAFGVTFSPEWKVSPLGVFDQAGQFSGTATVSMASGWVGRIVLFYYDTDSPLTANFYSGVNGTGNLLRSVTAPPGGWEIFNAINVPLLHSAVFDSATSTRVDSLGVGPVSVVPEPGGPALMIAAFAVVWSSRRWPAKRCFH